MPAGELDEVGPAFTVAVFAPALDGVLAAGTDTDDVAVTFPPWGGVPVAVAASVIDPAATSLAVVILLAVQASVTPGESDTSGQEVALRPLTASARVTGSSVTLPEFPIRYE